MQSPSFFESGDDPTEKDEPEPRGLVIEFAPRVPRAAARTMRRWGLPESVRDDLVSAGYLGLWKALKNRRRDAHEFELSAYVSRRIEGAVIDEARTLIGRATRCASIDPDLLDLDPCFVEGDSGFADGWIPEDPEIRAARASLWARVESSLEAVDPDVRDALLGLAAGHSVAELARSADRTAAQLQARITRGVRHLRGRSPELRRLLWEAVET